MKNLKFISFCFGLIFTLSSFTSPDAVALILKSKVALSNGSDCDVTITVNGGTPFVLNSETSTIVNFQKLVNGAVVCVFPVGDCTGSISATFSQYYIFSNPFEYSIPVDPCNVTEEIEFTSPAGNCKSITCMY